MTILKSLVFLIVAPGLVAGYIPLAFLAAGPGADIGVFSYLAFPLWLLGVILLLSSFWDFFREGHGTPAPLDPPRELVVNRFYACVRNPMYVGVILVLAGHALWFRTIGLAAYVFLVWLLCHLFVVFYEEPALRRSFGASYEAYCRSVPRWIPKFR